MRPREETDWMLGEARASAGLEGWLTPDLTRPVVYVKDCFFFSPKSKGSPLKSSSQICVLGSVDRLEKGGPGQREEQEQLGGFCNSSKISPKVMRTRPTPGWLEES